MQALLVVLSIIGCYTNTVGRWRRGSYAIWLLSNLGWIWFFSEQGMAAPVFLQLVYASLSIKGLLQRPEPS